MKWDRSKEDWSYRYVRKGLSYEYDHWGRTGFSQEKIDEFFATRDSNVMKCIEGTRHICRTMRQAYKRKMRRRRTKWLRIIHQKFILPILKWFKIVGRI